MPQHIVVSAYCSVWKIMFEEEAKVIKGILGKNCTAIYHIGSTSVPKLSAKPIIDIMPIVLDMQKVDEKKSEFEILGYEYVGELGIPGRRYLRKGKEERTHQIHIFEQSNKQDIQRHIAVRDNLRTHQEVARQYEALKRTLAQKFPYDITGYCNEKESFMQKLEQEALIWKKNADLLE